jgi:hypothetical protein
MRKLFAILFYFFLAIIIGGMGYVVSRHPQLLCLIIPSIILGFGLWSVLAVGARTERDMDEALRKEGLK